MKRYSRIVKLPEKNNLDEYYFDIESNSLNNNSLNNNSLNNNSLNRKKNQYRQGK